MQILGLINSKKLHSAALNLLHSEVLNEKNVPRGVFSLHISEKSSTFAGKLSSVL
jgi:hypothetical protein